MKEMASMLVVGERVSHAHVMHIEVSWLDSADFSARDGSVISKDLLVPGATSWVLLDTCCKLLWVLNAGSASW